MADRARLLLALPLFLLGCSPSSAPERPEGGTAGTPWSTRATIMRPRVGIECLVLTTYGAQPAVAVSCYPVDAVAR